MLSVLLFPVSWLYGGLMRLRNFLYDKGWKKGHQFPVAVICIGNLNVGGSGKTPMVEYLIRLLAERYQVAVLSRGYGRKTRGFRLAAAGEDPSSIGDEPYQCYQKFSSQVTVAVCESRAEGIQQLLQRAPETTLVLLDDAFQHRAVRADFSLLLTDITKPFFADHVLPAGRLREPREGSARADAIVVTKCAAWTPEMAKKIIDQVVRYSGPRPVFFAGIQYQQPVSFGGGHRPAKKLLLVTGIANSAPLVDYLTQHFEIAAHRQFEDHHEYSLKELTDIQARARALDASIMTTEKDRVKIDAPAWLGELDRKLWFYLPIETKILDSGAEFDTLVLAKISAVQNHLFKNHSK